MDATHVAGVEALDATYAAMVAPTNRLVAIAEGATHVAFAATTWESHQNRGATSPLQRVLPTLPSTRWSLLAGRP